MIKNIEFFVHAFLWIGWIVMINNGSENGIGYFNQPDHNLLWPLIIGVIFNAAIFYTVSFWLVPNYLSLRKIKFFSIYLLSVSLIDVSIKSFVEKYFIELNIPSLRSISYQDLALENAYVLCAFIVIGLLYRFSRDWIIKPDISNANESGSGVLSDNVLIKSGSQIHRIPLCEIRYAKSEGNYVVFELSKTRLIAHMTMRQVMQTLMNDQFCQVHRSYIVGMVHISQVTKSFIEIEGVKIPLGGKHKEHFFKRLKSLNHDMASV